MTVKEYMEHAMKRYDYSPTEEWEPVFSPWRHGGSYVTNLRYPNGACGCIVSARHSDDGFFHIACGPRELTSIKFKTRREAAYAERAYVEKLIDGLLTD